MVKRFKIQVVFVILLCVAMVTGNYGTETIFAAGSKNEVEPNNAPSQADRTYNDYDNYGYISTSSDVDWWVVNFYYSGSANFFLGNIPIGCDYDLRLYPADVSILLGSSLKYGNASELITYEVAANTDYYIRINSSSGSSTNSPYLFRTKVYPSKVLSTVPLYTQEESNTCGSACGRMILKHYGILVSELDFKNKANDIAEPGHDFTYVYAINGAINYYLSVNGKSTRYNYVNVSAYTDEAYSNLLLTNILNSHPIQLPLRITNTYYFPYTTNGHYVVLKGMNYSSATSSYTAVVNDPHNNYSNTYYLPVSALFSYNKTHSGYLICVD